MRTAAPFVGWGMLGALALAALIPSRALADDLDVGRFARYRSIQAAIDDALPGDRIRVARGRYRESLDVGCATLITLSGGWSYDFRTQTRDPSLTVVDPEGAGLCLLIRTSVGVENMTFENGRPAVPCAFAAGGITASATLGAVDVWLHDVVVQDCVTPDSPASGILLLSMPYALHADLQRVVVRRNAPRGGVCVLARRDNPTLAGPGGEAEVFLSGSLIYSNTANLGGGVWVEASNNSTTHMVIANSTITDNTSSITEIPFVGAGGGLFGRSGVCANSIEECVPGDLRLDVYNTIVYGNHAVIRGADVALELGGALATAYLSHCDIGDADYYVYAGGSLSSITEDTVLDVPPGFYNPSVHNYHLGVSSPLVGVGTTAIPDPPGVCATDLDGHPRPMGAGIEIGMDEVYEIDPEFYYCPVEMLARGTGLAADLHVLRAFRDDVLLRVPGGRLAVRGYYRAAPAAVRWLEGREALQRGARATLRTVVWALKPFFPDERQRAR